MTVEGAPSVWSRFCRVGGIQTEVLGMDATSGFPRLQVVVFPGNPGSAAYFKPFMRQVHQQLSGLAHVLAVTHAGHDPETDHGGRLWDLAEQIDHKVAFLREHVLLPGRPPVVLVGHSIGATMMVKAVARVAGSSGGGASAAAAAAFTENPLAVVPPCSPFAAADVAAAGSRDGLPPILKLVAVFPFFETNFSGNFRQRRLRMLSPWYDTLGWVGAAVTSLPWSLQLGFVRLNAAMDAEASALTAKLLRRHTVRNAFFLASHEFRELSQPWDWSLLGALGSRLHVMACEADTWMSRQQYDHMLEQVPGLQATWHPDLRHAFCTSACQSTAVAEVVASIARTLPDLTDGPAQQAPLWGSRATSTTAVSVSRASSATASTLTSSSAAASRDSLASAATAESADDGGAASGRGPDGGVDVGLRQTQSGFGAQLSQPGSLRRGPHGGDDQRGGHGHGQRRLYGDDVAPGGAEVEAMAEAVAAKVGQPVAVEGLDDLCDNAGGHGHQGWSAQVEAAAAR